MATNTGTVMTIANSIIGVSVLAMPFCFKQCGIILSIVMLILSSVLTRLTCYFLLKSAMLSRRRTFEYLAFHIFGPTGKFLTELCIIGYLMGTCIAFFVIVGDLGPEIISESLEITNSPALRPSFMIGLAVIVILPLGLLRNVDSLSSVCIASIGFYFCLVLKVFFEALPHLLSGIWLENVHYWRPAGVLQCLPIFSGALFCQMTLFEIYESLPNPSLERMNAAVHTAINMCTAFYISVGFLGYVAFCTEPFGGNILLSFLPSVMSDLFKFGFVLSLAVSFPLVIFPCRVSLNSLIYRRIQGPQHESSSAFIPELRFKCLTSVIIAISLAVGLVIPNIELVLGLVGSTIGVAICVMFPALAFISVSGKRTADRATAQFLLGAGVVILVLGTYATLAARSEHKSEVKLNVETAFAQPQVVDVAAVVAAVHGKEKEAEPLVVVARREPPVPQESGKAEPAEVIHKDALKKEDEELAAAEKQDSGESERKNVELLRKIEKNKEEQEKLLQEQKALILGLQKESVRKAVSAERKMNDIVKVAVKEANDNGAETAEVALKPDLQQVVQSVVAKEELEMRSPSDGVIVKPAVDVANSIEAKDSKRDDNVMLPKLSEEKSAEKRESVNEAVVKVKSAPFRNMTIKSIVMPDFANKIPIVRQKAAIRSRDVQGKVDEPAKNNELDFKMALDKIVSADVLKSNQRDILSADDERREREKRDADVATETKVDLGDCKKAEADSSDSLIKVGGRLSDPSLDAGGVASVDAGFKDVVDESKPLSRDLKSLATQVGGKNVTAVTEIEI